MAEKMMGYSPSGLFGYSHLTGGYAGGQAQFVRVPFADVGPFKIPDELSDDQVVFLTDIFPTGYMAAENCSIQGGDTVAVWGCGPVGQFCIRSATLLGAKRVVAIDDVPERLQMAAAGGAVPLDFSQKDVYETLLEITAGRGPDACIDAVGAEAHGVTFDAAVDRVKTSVMMGTDRAHALRQAVNCCRKGGTLSVPGVYVGFPDNFPMGALMNKGLTVKTGQTHVMRYLPQLTEMIVKGRIDPRFVITHTLPLEDAPHGYDIFQKKKEGCIKVVLKPWANTA
jgi:threonine dehydrogenase-like Zn-dependent dehydrogenase